MVLRSYVHILFSLCLYMSHQDITSMFPQALACYFDYSHDLIEPFIKVLNNYTTRYIIGLEYGKTKKPHFQCVFFVEDIAAFKKNFVSTLFRHLPKLSGKNKEYGYVKSIRCTRKMCQYCTKDGKYFSSGIKQTDMEKLYNDALQYKSSKEQKYIKKIALDSLFTTFWATYKPKYFHDFYTLVFNHFQKIKEPMPSKHRLLKEAFKHKCITNEIYALNVGLRFYSLS